MNFPDNVSLSNHKYKSPFPPVIRRDEGDF
jgi:hypothetical protein